MALTLEQLRAENATQDQATAAPPQDAPKEDPVIAADVTDTETPDADQDEPEEGAKVEPEGWMKGDDQESQDAGDAPKIFSHKDIAAAKTRLRTQLEERHQSELDKLKAELEARAQQAPRQTARPTREQFYDHDDPDDAYAEALIEWKQISAAAQQQAQRQQLEQERAQIEHVQAVEASVDQHYVRAAKLVEQSGISEDLYRAADERVRTAIDEVFPGGGEAVTNILIDLIGDGSERVMYHLGVNSARRAELKEIMRNDPKGLKAAAFLGKLSAELTAPAKRKSNAPPPASQINGDANTSPAGAALKREYEKAHKNRDSSKAFNLKREAKAKGVDTSSW